MSDQSFHAALKTRTAKTVKVGHDSSACEMVEQRAFWKSPDTINIASCSRSDHNSIILKKAEARSCANRADAKNLIARLIEYENLSSDHAEGVEEFSKMLSQMNYCKKMNGVMLVLLPKLQCQ